MSPPLSVSDERRAERTLIRQYLDTDPIDRIRFLRSFGIPQEEMTSLLSKYSHLVEGYKLLTEEEKNGK